MGFEIFDTLKKLSSDARNRSTFMGIAIHNVSASSGVEDTTSSFDLSAAVRQTAGGLLGTSVQLADLVRRIPPIHRTNFLEISD